MLDAKIVEILDVMAALRDLIVTASVERLDSYGKVQESVDAVAKLISPTLPRAMHARLDRYCGKWAKLTKDISPEMKLSVENVKEAVGDLVDLYGDCVGQARRWQKLG